MGRNVSLNARKVKIRLKRRTKTCGQVGICLILLNFALCNRDWNNLRNYIYIFIMLFCAVVTIAQNNDHSFRSVRADGYHIPYANDSDSVRILLDSIESRHRTLKDSLYKDRIVADSVKTTVTDSSYLHNLDSIKKNFNSERGIDNGNAFHVYDDVRYLLHVHGNGIHGLLRVHDNGIHGITSHSIYQDIR